MIEVLNWLSAVRWVLILHYNLQVICNGVEHYTTLSHRRLTETGFYHQAHSELASDQVGADSWAFRMKLVISIVFIANVTSGES